MSIISSCGSAPFDPHRVDSQAGSGAAAAASSDPSASNLSVLCSESGELMNTLKKITLPRSCCVSDRLRCVSKTIPQNTPIMSKMIRFLPPECPHEGALVRALRHLSGATTQRFSGVHGIQTRILRFLEPRGVDKATSDLPSGCGSYLVDDLLEHTYLQGTDSRFRKIGKEVWVKCFGDAALLTQGLSFRESPSLQSLNAIREFVESLNQFAAIPVEGDVGSTLMTLPDGLTLNNLRELAKAPQEGHQPAGIRYIQDSIAAKYGKLAVEGGLVAISNGVLLGSRNKSSAEQSALVAGHGCQMPRLVDAVALCFLTYINSSSKPTDAPERLLNDAPLTYTRCIEQVVENGNSYNLFVGGFAPACLNVHHDFLAHKRYGVCVLQKF